MTDKIMNPLVYFVSLPGYPGTLMIEISFFFPEPPPGILKMSQHKEQ